MTAKSQKNNPNAIKRYDFVEILRGKDFLGQNLKGKKAQIVNPWVSKGVICLRVEGETIDIFFERKNVKKVGENGNP